MASITLEYKRTDEYKQLYAMIKEDKPDMPDYLIDMAIALHKADPKLYKKNHKTPPVAVSKSNTSFIVEDAIKVYDAADVPKADPIEIATI